MENRVAGLTVMGMQMKVDDAYLNAELQLEEGYRNPRAAVAVGVCYRVNENFQGSAPWHQRLSGWSSGVSNDDEVPLQPSIHLRHSRCHVPQGTARGPTKEAFVAAKQRPTSAAC